MEIAAALDRKINERMCGKKREHVVEEPQPGSDVRFAGAIESE